MAHPDVRGCVLPLHLYYSVADHTWVQVQADGRARVGMTDVAQNLAGPLLHTEAKLGGAHAAQARWKAETVAAAMKEIGLDAWAPGYNDWADGGEALATLSQETGETMLGVGTLTPSKLVKLGNAKSRVNHQST